RRATCPFCGSSQFLAATGADPNETGADEDVLPVTVDETFTAEQPTEEAPYRRRRPLMPNERQSIVSAQNGTKGRLIALGAIVAVVALVGGIAYWRVSLFFAKHTIDELIHQASREEDTDGAAKGIAARLSLTISHVNDLYAAKRNDELLNVTTGLRNIFPRLPEGTDLTPLLDLTPRATVAHATAVLVVQQRHDRAWLLDRTCRGSEAARNFAVEALRPTFPLAELSDEEKAQLAERMDVDEKTVLAATITQAVHQRFEQRWVGRYRIHIDAAWQFPNLPVTQHQWTSKAAPLAITCAGGTWKATLGSSTWSGTAEKLSTLRVTCPLREVSDAGLGVAPFTQVSRAEVGVAFAEGFTASVGPVPRYRDTQQGTTPIDSPSRIPKGTMVVGQGVGTRLGLPTPVFQWVLPARAGFTVFQAKLVKAD
ncbi:hypothetical protein HQ576_19910, partial [bacterium]|nr:hypothetical protein [bacterium]